MKVELIAATADQEPILANLLELYCHDFSEITALHLNSSGRFGYAPLPLYWQESGRYPFLVKVNNNLSGFVLVKKGSEISGDQDVWDIAEFFIVRGYRRHGIGMRAAHDVWKKFPGYWEIRVLPENQGGEAFWKRAIASFMGFTIEAGVVESTGKISHVFSFDTALAKTSAG